jgi:hypothetical protein
MLNRKDERILELYVTFMKKYNKIKLRNEKKHDFIGIIKNK